MAKAKGHDHEHKKKLQDPQRISLMSAVPSGDKLSVSNNVKGKEAQNANKGAVGEGAAGDVKFGMNGNDTTADDKLAETNPESTIMHWTKHRRKTYNYFNLFRYSTVKEKIMLLIGFVAALASGICIPMMIWLFGNLTRQMVYFSLRTHKDHCSGGWCAVYYTKCNYSANIHIGHFYQSILDIIYDFATLHAVLAAIYTVLTGLYFFCWYLPAEKQIARMQLAYFEAILRKDSSWSENRVDRDFTNKIMENTRRIREGIGESVPMGISLHSMFLICLIMAFCHGWALTLVALVAIPILSFCATLVSSLHARQVIAEQKAYSSAREMAEEALSCIQTIFIYGASKKMSARYRKAIADSERTVNRSMYVTSLAIGLKWMMTFWLFALVLWYGLRRTIQDLSCGGQYMLLEYDVGDVVIIFLCVFFVMINDGPCFPFYLSIKIATVCGRDVFWIIDTKSDIDSMGKDGFSFSEPVSGKIDFEDVSFTYNTAFKTHVLNGLSMSVQPGMKVAIVGTNGCGKSTILNLLLKEYLADSGFVKIDGVDIKTLNTHWIRSHIGIVSQDPSLFDDTIEQNVRMGKLNATFFEIQDACKKANAHEFIVSLKEGYQTKIGVDGKKLTSSQRQRLSVARALIRNPKILLLDEPTSSLDAHSENIVLQTLEEVCKNRTVITVAHRLQTIVNADMIYVLKRGRVIEKGTHLALLKNKGPYSQLASGLYDGPSAAHRKFNRTVEPFDVTERNATNYLRSFNTVPLMINRINNLLTLDPVVEKVTRRYIIQREANLKHKFRGREEFDFELSSEPIIFPKQSPSILKIEEPTEDQVEIDIERQAALVETYVHATNSEDEFESITYTYWKILAFVSKSKGLIICGILTSIVMGLGTPVYGILFGRVLTRFSYPDGWYRPSGGDFESNMAEDKFGKWWILGFVVLGVVLGATSVLQNILLNMAGYRVMRRLRSTLFASILQKDTMFFDDPQTSTASLSTILDHDVGSMRFIVTSFYGTFIQCVVTVMASIAYSCIYNKHLTGYVVAMFPVMIGLPLLESWLGKLHEKKIAHDIEQMSELILEVFNKLHIVATLQLEPYFIDQLNVIQKRVHKSKNKYILCRVITFALAHSSCFWAYSLFMYLGGNEIVYNGYAYEDIVTIGEILIFGLIALGSNLSVIASFDLAVEAGDKILTLLNKDPGIRNAGGEIVTTCSGEVVMKDVHFWYPYSSDMPQLRGINLKVDPGSVVAVVGSPESGKCSYLSVLLRLYDVIGGTITLDGMDIKNLNIPSYRSNFGVVDSNAHIFKTTVAENVALGDNTREVTMQNVMAAAKRAGVHHFIVSLPDGYNTQVGTPEDLLTDGHKQRICIARALLRDPSILLCHDVVSEVDRENEKIIIESIEGARQDCTCIIIAHRLFSIQKADLICVMHEGEIVERGNHRDLMKAKGKYFEMWKLQNPIADENFRHGKMSFDTSDRIALSSQRSDTRSKAKRKVEKPNEVKKEPEKMQPNTLMDKKPASGEVAANPEQPTNNTTTQSGASKDEPPQKSWGICNIFGQ